MSVVSVINKGKLLSVKQHNKTSLHLLEFSNLIIILQPNVREDKTWSSMPWGSMRQKYKTDNKTEDIKKGSKKCQVRFEIIRVRSGNTLLLCRENAMI